MDWVSETVSAFGHSVGIPELTLDADGCALFTLEPSGVLCLRDLQPTGGEEVLVILSRPLPPMPASCVRRALRMADFRTNPARQMQVALRDDELVVTLRMPRHSFLPSALEEAVEALFEFHAGVVQLH